MKATEAAALLTIAAAYDNRKPDADQAKAWAMALDGLRFEDCREVIVQHYRRSREWLMPVDVISGVRRIRSDRVARFGAIPAPDHLDPDSPTFDEDYTRYMAETTKAIGDGIYQRTSPKPLTSRDVLAELGHIGQTVREATKADLTAARRAIQATRAAKDEHEAQRKADEDAARKRREEARAADRAARESTEETR